MKISLLHPSRGRPEKAFATKKDWLYKANGENEIEHLISLDTSDSTVPKYYELFNNSGSKIFHYNNQSMVEACNRIAKSCTGELLIYFSDDFECPYQWDKLIVEYFKGVLMPMLLKVDDCLQNFNAEVLTIPIMNRQLYERLRYFWHPGYKSMFVDVDLFFTCKNSNWIKLAPELRFHHNHYVNKKSEKDETYKRSDANWNQGKQLFNIRKANYFPL